MVQRCRSGQAAQVSFGKRTILPGSNGQPEDHRGRALRQVPLARMGTADEVTAAVLWLLSEDVSYVTGATPDVAGGL